MLTRLSIRWFVLLLGTGRFSIMTSTILLWQSENCFRNVVCPHAATNGSRPWNEILHDWNAPWPLSFVEWNAPCHDILHHWNGKAVALAQQHGLNAWSEQCLQHHWKFAMRVANLPSNRWVKRVLLWNPTGARTRGYPRHDWTSTYVAYTRFHQLSQWLSLAQDPALWMQLSDDFVKFCSTS